MMVPADRAMHEAEVVALAYRYPGPGSLDRLADAANGLAKGAVRRNLERFLSDVGELELGEVLATARKRLRGRQGPSRHSMEAMARK